MDRYFINPNWHVLFIHLPLGVLLTGIIIEFICLTVRKQSLRTAGRWMILIGTLGAIVTVMSGVFAFRDVVAQVPTIPEFKWHDLVQKSTWSPQQWEFMEDHITNNLAATGLFVLAVFVYLAASEKWRQSLYWPVLLLLLAGAGFVTVGAWQGGESVYRFGAAISPGVFTNIANAAADTGYRSEIKYFIPPLQLHIVLAGTVVALMVLGLAFIINAWRNLEQRSPAGIALVGNYAGLVWLVTFLGILAAATAGLWSITRGLNSAGIKLDIELLKDPGHLRLLIHLIAGLSFALLALLICIVSFAAKRKRVLAGILIAAALFAAAVLVWLGVLMLYDSQEGPLYRFSPADSGRQVQQTSAARVPSVAEQLQH